MKSIIIIALFLVVNVCTATTNKFESIRICDINNEMIAGAKVIIDNQIFYTGINGTCNIPVALLDKCKSIKVECISFKTKELKTIESNSKIILEFR